MIEGNHMAKDQPLAREEEKRIKADISPAQIAASIPYPQNKHIINTCEYKDHAGNACKIYKFVSPSHTTKAKNTVLPIYNSGLRGFHFTDVAYNTFMLT